MATKDEPTRKRIETIKANLQSTSTCTAATVTTLQELLLKKENEPVEKENVKAKTTAPARKRAATATAVDLGKQTSPPLAPREKYILATEVANTTLKSLADALKNPPSAPLPRPSSRSKPNPNEAARKPTKSQAGNAKAAPGSKRPLKERSVSQLANSPQKPAPRRSASYSSFLSADPDAGLVATAECARIAFAYLGTLEAKKVLGSDGQDLQLENGVLALIGKLIALGLDNLAVKEMRILKKRLEKYLGHDNSQPNPRSTPVEKSAQRAETAEKESLATLLQFGIIDPKSPALPLVASLQTYALRVIAKLNRPRIIEATWEHLKLSNPSSPANLIYHTATTPAGQAKAARQLEALAQIILTFCPSISSTHDEKPLQTSPDTAVLLQQLAFKVRKRWWALAKHQGNEDQELLEPFAKCLNTFNRRSQLSPLKKYKLAESLCVDLTEKKGGLEDSRQSNAALNKVLSSLAQAADLNEEALQLLGSSGAASPSASQAKETARLVRIAAVSIDAFLKGDSKASLEDSIAAALSALKGSLSGSSSDLETLFMESNLLRRAATKIIVSDPSKVTTTPSLLTSAVSIIAATIHLAARFVGMESPEEGKAQQQDQKRMTLVWKCTKSIIDSAMACCKQIFVSEEQWKELDMMMQECSHILQRLEKEVEDGADFDSNALDVIQSIVVKLSNAYWVIYQQLRKTKLDPKCGVTAMQRSITLVQPMSAEAKEGGHLNMKLEQLGDVLNDMGCGESSRKAFDQCIRAHLESNSGEALSNAAAKEPLQGIFDSAGSFKILTRVLKSHHLTFIKFGLLTSDEVAFFDDTELPPSARGALLECQLSLYLRTLSRNRAWDASLNSSIVALVENLRGLYTPEQYPIRYLRLLTTLIRLSQSNEGILQSHAIEEEIESISAKISGSEDENLIKYEAHLKAMYNLKLCMQHAKPATDTLQECLSTWESLITSASTWTGLVARVDNTEDWIQDLQACIEWLNAKGEEYLALPVLHLLVKLGELQKGSDRSQLVKDLCTLGLQFLRLGYTGRAGMALAKAEALVEGHATSTEVKLQWHNAYAEYLARIGNTLKGITIMSAAQNLALSDIGFMNLAKSSSTLSGRLRFNRILADASYVYSLLATTSGSYKDAARHARQCVALNRRIWAALESRINAKKAESNDDADAGLDQSTKADPNLLSSMRTESGAALVVSVTHNALNGPEFWCLVPALYRGLMQHSQIFAHQGLLHEAIYVAEQAEKIAAATGSETLMTDNASWRADCWAQSGRPHKAEAIFKDLTTDTTRRCLSNVGYHSAVARTHHWNGQYKEEVISYGLLDQLLRDLTSPSFVRTLDLFSANVDSVTEQISKMSLDTTESQPTKAITTTRGRKPVVKPTPRATTRAAPKSRAKATPVAATAAKAVSKRTPTTAAPVVNPSIAEQCSTLRTFQAGIMHRGVLANLLQDDLVTASDLLKRIEEVQSDAEQDVSHAWVTYKTLLAQTFKEIAEDIAINTLPESTIAFPAIGFKELGSSETAPTKRTAAATSTVAKGGRAKKQIKEDFTSTLRSARDRLVEVHAAFAAKGSNHMFQQVSTALSNVTVLLSAVSGGELHGSLHPLYAAYMSEAPKCNAMRLTQESIEAEQEQMSRDDCLRWPVMSPSKYTLASVSDFQSDYVDIIPPTWSTVSLAMNDTHDELYITRFESGLSPFVLRLPLARHASRDMDEEEFSFEDGKKDFEEIIELSDFSTRSAKDMTSREARQQWWTEREALDARLHELLLNMENIWLGGFKGVFSQHERQPDLLARFRKSLENVLNQHLPSRRKKSQQKRPLLDTRVLELFIGLGDATDEELDLDEALMDLIYFVVDILHFNGERNAYDEIDFDAMVVETHEALRAYHSAADASGPSRHVILILDNNLHGFPWESMPFLEKLSISRLPSLAALRERIIAAQTSTNQQTTVPGHYIQAKTGGTSILNPSGDLSHTLKTLKPRLDSLNGPWTHIANRAPTEKEFEDSLREKDLVLYFGHGSGAQFVRSKSVRRLYPGPQDEHNRKPGCATTFLFGCSSVHLSENGIYEPSGMLASYLTAGAPAVVGMLWDVTDKDCDRFAITAGELWGLWSEPQEEPAPVAPPKTPGRKGKGKSRVAQLTEDFQDLKPPSSARKSKRTKSPDVEDRSKQRQGLGLDECVRDARKSCVLRYLNGAAAVVYGIPVYLE